ncbi:lyase family protein [Arthrobacter cupressi]|uniref:Aspartate ammonia-lyase n=1 Tax=Arthrobacter cupressi TaxID=1045773 RepID=A0A1G8YF60_9MICC|nr:lyase family protein [Arthrobacter cupressi]NYD79660.1 aspartate ammonia-lyase [Arthrobacter cupressi]SDK01341.1 aspartate ammonia-lyase [Arthrobacter cupressi]
MTKQKFSRGKSRVEKDLFGAGEIPAEAYWGIHTLRALQIIPVTGIRLSSYPVLVKALALVKRAAVLGNSDRGLISEEKKVAIVQACKEIEQGDLLDQFVVDIIQGGAGSPSVMNVNEVIANRALEILGHTRGAYEFIHPMRDVNMGQSTTKAYAVAVQIAAINSGLELLHAMAFLRGQLARKALEFEGVATISRTPARDPQPMTLAQEFTMYAALVNEDEQGIREALVPVHQVSTGEAAIATGADTHQEYALAHLLQMTGLPLGQAGADLEKSEDCSAFVLFSGALKRTALRLSGMCSNLRLRSSMPWTGLADINPAIPEGVNQLAFKVVGNDLTMAMADEEQGQSSVFKPIIAQTLLASLAYLTSACTTLAEHCISGITANNHVSPQTKEESR